MLSWKKLVLAITLIGFTAQYAMSADIWVNDLRKMFTKNSSIIYEINLRTFGAQDINKDGIIDFEDGEESGTFLNAIPRLDELAAKRINTIHVLPITPVGKTKALGTAGSLYAASSFNTINPQLVSDKSALSAKSQAIKFVNEAHKRGIRVIIDLYAKTRTFCKRQIRSTSNSCRLDRRKITQCRNRNRCEQRCLQFIQRLC